MKTITILILAILSIFSFIVVEACKEQKTGWKGKIEIVDAVKIIHNFQKNQDEAFKPLELAEDLSIGVEEGDENYMFTYPVDIDSDSAGNIYVLDYRECTVKKYDAQGKHIKNIGRGGQGPGEFQMPLCLEVSQQDIIYVGDILSRKIEIFNSNGDYSRTLRVTNSVDQISVNPNEKLIAGFRSRKEDENKEVKFIYQVCNYNYQKNEFFDIYKQRRLRYDSLSAEGISLEVPLYVRWDVDSGGNIYVATANKYEINVFSSKGQLLFKFKRDYEQNPIEDELKERVFKRLTSSRIPIDAREFEKDLKFYPIFKSISVDEKNRVWVELFQPPKKNYTIKSTLFDVFSSDGKFLFSTKIDKIVYPQLVFKNGYMYVLSREESGFSRALRLRTIEN